jgi:hypothetical protein
MSSNTARLAAFAAGLRLRRALLAAWLSYPRRW